MKLEGSWARKGHLVFLLFHIVLGRKTAWASPRLQGDGGTSGGSTGFFVQGSSQVIPTERRVCHPRQRHFLTEKDSGDPLSQPERDLSPPFPTVCQNCIELSAATVSGFVFAEIISILFLAVGVYFIAGQDGGHQSRGKVIFLDER